MSQVEEGSGLQITRFRVQNFRSLKDVTLTDMGRFVVLYGPNGAGKSNILRALEVFSQIWASGNVRLEKNDYFLSDVACAISFEAELFFQGKSKDIQYEIKDGKVYGDISNRWEDEFFRLIPAIRHLNQETGELGKSTPVSTLLQNHRIQEALLRMQFSKEARVRSQFKQLQDILQGPPFHRGRLLPTVDGDRFVLQEEIPDGRTLEMDAQGLGIEQLLIILTNLLLADRPVVGLEEPEAHLHERTTGQQLRQLLTRLVQENVVSQMFIATHSSLFDLDAGGYYDVSFQPDTGTVVQRLPLTEIENRHTWEPGPAAHALRNLLRTVSPEKVIAYGADGVPITVARMARLVQEDDPAAMDFVKSINDAALHAVNRSFGKKSSDK